MKTREELIKEYFEEPQGKRETKKYNHARGLLQVVPSTFDDDEMSKFLERAWQTRR